MITTGLLMVSTAVLIVWGVIDWRAKHKRDAVFLFLLGIFDGTAAFNSYFEFKEVEAHLAPRHLSSAEKQRFAGALRDAPKLPLEILLDLDARGGQREEQKGFAEDIRQGFTAAGWTVTVSTVAYPRRPQLMFGVGIFGDQGNAAWPRIGTAFSAIGYEPFFSDFNAAQYVAAPIETGLKGQHVQVQIYNRPPRD